MSIFLLFNNSESNDNNSTNSTNSNYTELQYLYTLLIKVKELFRENFSAISIDTKISTRPNRKADLRNSFSGTLDQTITKVGSERGYATRKNL
jgi:hypothetical protein